MTSHLLTLITIVGTLVVFGGCTVLAGHLSLLFLEKQSQYFATTIDGNIQIEWDFSFVFHFGALSVLFLLLLVVLMQYVLQRAFFLEMNLKKSGFERKMQKKIIAEKAKIFAEKKYSQKHKHSHKHTTKHRRPVSAIVAEDSSGEGKLKTVVVKANSDVSHSQLHSQTITLEPNSQSQLPKSSSLSSVLVSPQKPSRLASSAFRMNKSLKDIQMENIQNSKSSDSLNVYTDLKTTTKTNGNGNGNGNGKMQKKKQKNKNMHEE